MMLPASKIYKLKISNLNITVTIDSSLTGTETHFDTLSSAEKIGVHRHAVHELFFVGEKTLVVLNENAPLEYKNCLVCIPPFFAHNSIRNEDYRMLISCSGDFGIFVRSYYDEVDKCANNLAYNQSVKD